MRKIDDLLNSITMYRLVTYGLAGLAALGIVFAALGQIGGDPVAMVLTLTALVAACSFTDAVLARIWRVPANTESWLITALILFLILNPTREFPGILGPVIAGMLASASKYIVAWRGKHVFNPAALAAAVVGLTTLHPVTWWVGSAALWPYTLVVGLAVVRKIRRFPMVLTFAVVSVGVQLAVFVLGGKPVWHGMQQALIASPLIFLGTIMLTEPATMPPRRRQQQLFAAMVAVLYVMAWKVGPIYIYPEVALLLGNVFAFVAAPKYRLRLELLEVQRISDNVHTYVFRPDRRPTFAPGQYMEWTLPGVPLDNRGNRRTFTLASSPTEATVQLGVKFYEPSSAYKTVLRSLQPGDVLYAGQLAGSFTLPADSGVKLALIAGGIGITPFRSMLKYIIDTGQQRDVVLLYAVADPREVAYRDVLGQAAAHGVRTSIVQTPLTPELLAQYIPDYAGRAFFISGPPGMVTALRRNLRRLHVPRRRIKTDYFPGY